MKKIILVPLLLGGGVTLVNAAPEKVVVNQTATKTVAVENKETDKKSKTISAEQKETDQHAADVTALDEIIVTAGRTTSTKKSILNKETLKKGLLLTEKDLLRQETGIHITDGGRAGNNGFTMRGVDRDRVSIRVDGMAAAESFMAKEVNKLGFFNGNRNSTELENISQVAFVKGSNSLTEGSGAVGGSVSMKTKTVRDFVAPGRKFGLYSKTAYHSRNNQWIQVVGAGADYKGVEALFQYTYKNGHENKNYFSGTVKDVPFCGKAPPETDVNGYPTSLTDLYPDLCGISRILPDTVDMKTHSVLFKLGYRPNDEHFMNAFYEGMKRVYNTEEKSNSVGSATRRRTEDASPYHRFGLIYEYTPMESAYIDTVKTQLVGQMITQHARSYQYGSNKRYEDGEYGLGWDQIDTERNNDMLQKRVQFDIEGVSQPLAWKNTEHTVSMGLGLHHSAISSTSYEITPPSWGSTEPKRIDYTVQQPVHITSGYLYAKDRMRIGEKLDISLGARLDAYRYVPRESNLPYFDAKQDTSAQPAKNFAGLIYEAAIAYRPIKNIAIDYSLSSAFRAPKIEELYFVHADAGGGYTYESNLNLKPERSINNELGLQFQGEAYAIGLTGYFTHYRNFIDQTFDPIVKENWEYQWKVKDRHVSMNSDGKMSATFTKGWGSNKKTMTSVVTCRNSDTDEEVAIEGVSCKSLGYKYGWYTPNGYKFDKVVFRSANIGSAYVGGFEINAKVTGALVGLPKELYTTFKATYAKGRKSDGTSLMAVAPFTTTLGFGYQSQKWDFLINTRIVAPKRGKDAIVNIQPVASLVEVNKETGKIELEAPYGIPGEYPFLSKAYATVDITASWRPNKYINIYAGIFNVFNTRYTSWENLNQLKRNGLKSWVQNDGKGLERYTNAGRNFALSAELRY